MDTAIFIGYNWVTVATYEASHDWKVMGHRPRVSPPNARTPANRCWYPKLSQKPMRSGSRRKSSPVAVSPWKSEYRRTIIR